MTLARKVRGVRFLEINVDSLYFLTELLFWEKNTKQHYERKEPILIRISSLLLALVVGCCLILTV